MPILCVLDLLGLIVEQLKYIPDALGARFVQNDLQCAVVDYAGIVLEDESNVVVIAADRLPDSTVPQIDGNFSRRHAALGKSQIAPD